MCSTVACPSGRLEQYTGTCGNLLAKLGHVDVMVIDDWAMAALMHFQQRAAFQQRLAHSHGARPG